MVGESPLASRLETTSGPGSGGGGGVGGGRRRRPARLAKLITATRPVPMPPTMSPIIGSAKSSASSTAGGGGTGTGTGGLTPSASGRTLSRSYSGTPLGPLERLPSDTGIDLRTPLPQDRKSFSFRQRAETSTAMPSLVSRSTADSLAAHRSYDPTYEEDYTKPSPSRPFEIHFGIRSIFVNPSDMIGISPTLTNFVNREMYSAKAYLESEREDLTYEEALELAKVLGPTEMGLFPKPVDTTTFNPLAAVAYRLKIPRVREACEVFVSQMSLTSPVLSAEELVMFLVTAYRYALGKPTRIRLLEAVVGRETVGAEEQTASVPLLSQLISEAVKAHQTNRLAHGSFTTDVKLRVPCRTCRIEQPLIPLNAEQYPPVFFFCTRCRSTLCCECTMKPCKKSLEEFIVRFVERNQPRDAFSPTEQR